MGKNDAGKGSNRRPTLVSKAENDLRWKYAYGNMTFKEFESRLRDIRRKEKK